MSSYTKFLKKITSLFGKHDAMTNWFLKDEKHKFNP